jgi:DNA polymerase-3 subunit beta
VLAGVFISANDAGVTFETSDLETSVRHVESALIEQAGATVAPGKLFSDIVKSLPEAAVSLELDGEQLFISCQGTQFRVSTLDPVDFPQFPYVAPSSLAQVPVDTLSTMVKRVARAVSRDPGRVVLTGIFLKVGRQGIRMVATDSYRLAISNAAVDPVSNDSGAAAADDNTGTGSDENPAVVENLTVAEDASAADNGAADAFAAPTDATSATSAFADFEMIISGPLLEEVCRAAAHEDRLTIGEAENKIILQFGSTTFISRKIEGNFPNYEQIIPSQKSISATVNTEALLAAVRRVSIVAKNNSPIRFLLHSDAQLIEVRTQSQDIGEANESVPAQIDGEGFEIGFNHQYILDGLTVAGAEELVFEAQTAVKPGIFKTPGNQDYFYLTMPVRLER